MPAIESQAAPTSFSLRSAMGIFKALNPFASSQQPASIDLRVLDAGARLQDYIIDGSLGHDGVVASYLGHSVTTGDKVIIKEFLPSTLATREVDLSVVPDADENGPDFFRGLERFVDEGESLRQANHPNVAKVIDLVEAHRTAYVVFSHVTGERLEQRKARLGALGDAELVALSLGVLSGLEYLHAAGVVHGQINESCIVYGENDVPIIIFNDGAGLAAVRKRIANRARGNGGSSKYGNFGADEVKPAVDLFAVSMMLDRVGKTLADGVREQGARRVQHSPELANLLGRALAADTSDRPADAEVWRMEIERLQQRLGDPSMATTELDKTVTMTMGGPGKTGSDFDKTLPNMSLDLLQGITTTENQEEDFFSNEKPDSVPPQAAADAGIGAVEPAADVRTVPQAVSADTSSEDVKVNTDNPGVEDMGKKPQSPVVVMEIPVAKLSARTAVDVADNPAQLQQMASGVQQVLAEREQKEQTHRRRIEELEARLNERTALLERSAVQLKQYDTAMKQTRAAIAERDERDKALRQRVDELSRKLAERNATAALAGDQEQIERSMRNRIEELEARVAEQAAQLEKSTDHLEQYEQTLQQSNATTAGQSEAELALRARVAELERNLVEQTEAVETMAAERQKLTGALAEQRRLLEEAQRQVKEVAPLPGGQQLQHATQAQLVELRKILAAEFARNAALVEVARQESQGAEAARQRLVEQTELVLADYRSRNKKIRTQEEARIREERRLLEIEKEFLRSALDTANKAREEAELMAAKAADQANRLRTLTTTQIDSIESEVGSDLRKVRNALPWTPKSGVPEDELKALASEDPLVKSGSASAA